MAGTFYLVTLFEYTLRKTGRERREGAHSGHLIHHRQLGGGATLFQFGYMLGICCFVIFGRGKTTAKRIFPVGVSKN